MFVYILQPGIYRRFKTNAVDINGRFKLNATSNDNLKTQKVDGSSLYDALDSSFNAFGKTSMLKTNNVDILQSITHKASTNEVYNNNEIGYTFSNLIGAAPAVLDFSVALAAALGNDQHCDSNLQNQMIINMINLILS